VSGSKSDSYLGGLFQTSSAGNMARRAKRAKQRREGKAVGIIFGNGRVRQTKPQGTRRIDQFAELLSQGLEPWECAEKMGLKRTSGRVYLATIRKRLGPQAV
jgi:hypothetical protein